MELMMMFAGLAAPMLMEQLKTLVAENGFAEIATVADLAGHPRILTARIQR